jgi:AbrB family looped-hinge helix DNA binding protein
MNMLYNKGVGKRLFGAPATALAKWGASDRRAQPARVRGINPTPLVEASCQVVIDREAVMAAMDTARLSSKFQISIPKSIRAARSWKAGQIFAFIPKGEGVLLVPVPRLEDLAGVARGATQEDYRDRTDRV